MKQLSTVLPSTKPGVTVTEPQENISPILQLGLTRAGGKMTTEQMIAASQPREQAITIERAKHATAWLRRLKSLRKVIRTQNRQTNTLSIRTGYELPEGMTPESVCKGLVELCRPCSPTVVKHFVTLQAFKPFFDNDPERIAIVYDRLYDDIKEMPEVAVVMALDDLRNAEGRYFPLDIVLKEVTQYKELIFDVLDFFQENFLNLT